MSTLNSDIKEQFIANCFINKDANQSRYTFLERFDHIKFIRTGYFKAFSSLPKSEKDIVAIDQFYSVVNKGDFGNSNFPLQDARPSSKPFGIYVPVDLFHWFSRNSIQTIHKQIVLYNACIYYSNKMPETPFIILKKEIDNLINKYFRNKDLWNYDKIITAYNDAALDYYNSQVPLFLSLQNYDIKEDIFVRTAYFSDYDWNCYVLHKVTKNVLWRDFNNKTGLKPSPEERDDLVDLPEQHLERIYEDDLERSESDEDTWSKWLLTFHRYPMTKSHIYSLYNKENTSGYIYLFRSEHTNRCKIGWTEDEDVEKRKSQIQTASPETIEIVGFFPVSGRKSEKTLHRLFSEKKVIGEWFELSKDDIHNLLSPEWRRTNNIF